jgi:pSer/pThr/pTyr-binding forkhead associated (FHA) protein
MPWLRYQSPTRGVLWIELGGKPATIGRSPECTLKLDDESASRKHCEVRYAKGAFFAHDLGSKNGTWVNGVSIKADQPLKEGDLISVSASMITFCEKKG